MSGLITRFLDSADRAGHRVAVSKGGTSVTYVQLRERALSFAGYLQSMGLSRGDRVALILDNSWEYVVAYYGTIIAGGISVPLNAAAKRGEILTWLQHSDVGFLVAHIANQEVVNALAQLVQQPLALWVNSRDDGGVSTFTDAISSQSAALMHDTPGQAASILYTSGTSGMPKGVLLTHENIECNADAIVRYLLLGVEDSIVTVLPFYYSYGNSVLHTHMLSGARLIIEENMVYPHRVVERLAVERATGFAGVPSTFNLLLSRVRLDQYDLSSLRYVTQAGGAMPTTLVDRLRQALPKTQIFIMYGQTEATARISYLPPEDLDRKAGSVGTPIAGVQIKICGDEGDPLPASTIGHVWIKGPNVMQGYWRNAAATADVLHDHWLKTGDMGYLDTDGYLFLVGRRSDIIKTGAHRVHPEDVENVIAELEAVQECAVIGVEDELLGQVIKAFIVLAADKAADDLAIRQHCRFRLANYKIPKYFEFVRELPKTPSGKVRRHVLQS